MAVGSQLGGGRYVVRSVLGEGAQGVTYEASGPDGRVFAVKRFDVRGARHWKDVELAEREARVLATLDHPLVPRYVEHFEEEGALFVVMEKVEGESLDTILRRHGALPETEVRRFLRCADRALSYLHGRSHAIVHRDIKPRNVIRRPNGDYVFVDFGVVREQLGAQATGSTVAGTAGYMAPEQLQGRALPATDVYAVGVTALAALAGREPEHLPHRGLRFDARTALAGRASEGMIRALEAMLEPDPSLRATEVGPALEHAASMPPPGMAPMPMMQPVHPGFAPNAEEDAMVKSLRRLLWIFWGLSWIIVPILLERLIGDLFVALEFLMLAGIFALSWHQGFLLRKLVRRFTGRTPAVQTPPAAHIRVAPPTLHARVQVPSQDAFRQGEELGVTEVEPGAGRMTR